MCSLLETRRWKHSSAERHIHSLFRTLLAVSLAVALPDAHPSRPTPACIFKWPMDRVKEIADCRFRVKVVQDSADVSEAVGLDWGWKHSVFERGWPRALLSNPIRPGCREQLGKAWVPHTPQITLRRVTRGLALFEGFVLGLDGTRKRPHDAVLLSNGPTIQMQEMLHRLDLWRDLSEGDAGIQGPTALGELDLGSLRFSRVLQSTVERGWNSLNSLVQDQFEWYDHPPHFLRGCSEDARQSVRVSGSKQLLTGLRFLTLNFYHFIAEAFAPLTLLAKAISSQETAFHHAKLLIYDLPFVRAAVELLNLPNERIIFYDPCTVYAAEHVFFVDGTLSDDPSPASLRRTRLVLLPAARRKNDEDDALADVLIVDRRDKTDADSGLRQRAQIRNFKGLQKTVSHAARAHLPKTPGRTQVAALQFAGLPLASQIRRVHMASHLIGAEGAGLSHALWMGGDGNTCQVIALVPMSYSCGVSAIWHLVDVMGCDFQGYIVPGWQSLYEAVKVPKGPFKSFLAELWGELPGKTQAGAAMQDAMSGLVTDEL